MQHLRNIHQVKLQLSPGINLFYGENGSGKTSLLEAISLLGLGRSFRSHKTRSLIHHQQSQLTTFAEIDTGAVTLAVGVQKDRSGETLIRINQETAPSAAELARQLPLQIINADSFQLIEGSPLQRRQFLDWLVFHVKPEFFDTWRRLQRVIKQRNSLLRHDKLTRFDLASWDTEYVRLAEAVHQMRVDVFSQFLAVFEQLVSDQDLATVLTNVNLEYQRGWSEAQTLLEVLSADFDRDHRDGYTHHGPHRADIRIKTAGHVAADVLSRGQEKLLVCALHLAQAQLYAAANGQSCTFLVDDLLAELDQDHAIKLASWLLRLNCQVFVTGVNRDQLLTVWQQLADKADNSLIFSVFHVEQGQVYPDQNPKMND